MVRHPETGKYPRTRLFILMLAYSRKAVRLLVWQSWAQTWAGLYERAFSAPGRIDPGRGPRLCARPQICAVSFGATDTIIGVDP